MHAIIHIQKWITVNNCYGNFNTRYRTETVWRGCWIKLTAVVIERSKEGKIEVIHGLLKQHQTLCLLEIWSAVKHGRKSRRH